MQKVTWPALRLAMAFIFLWAFADKLFGLGYSTKPADAWVRGGSPTSGFLLHGTHGPLVSVFQSLAGHATVDWLFMLGLLCVGLALLLNKFVVWGAVAGGAMMILMWLAAFPPANNPIIDEHIVYLLVLALLAFRGRRGAGVR